MNPLELAIAELLLKTKALFRQRDLFYEAALVDIDRLVFLPEYENQNLIKQRQLAVNALCQLWHEDKHQLLPQTGFLSCSVETLQLAIAFNNSKSAFQHQIKLIRQLTPKHKLQKQHGKTAYLIEQVLAEGGRRNDDLTKAFKTLGIARLDLQKCYKNIRILPAHLQSLSWTWAKTHTEIQKMSHKQAVEICKALDIDDPLRIKALAQLATINQSETLVYKRKKKPQLRANLVYTEQKLIKRKAITVSGVLLSSDLHTPRFRWPNSSEQTRLLRMDKIIEDEVFIHGLHLYRYKNLEIS